MASVILDIKTEGLDNIIKNVEQTPKYITDSTQRVMEQWVDKHYLPETLNIILTGRPKSEIPETRFKYRLWKQRTYGYTHAFGILSGRLYSGVMNTPINIRTTRGREVRLSVEYKEPYYAPYLHGRDKTYGFTTKQGVFVPARPWGIVARDKHLPKLEKSLNKMMTDIDYSDSPELVSTAIRFGKYGPGV